jgi:hypothetical protein
MLRVDSDVRVIAFVGKEWGCSRRCAWSIVVSEFSEGKERGPVILLVVAENPEVLLEGLIKSFSLTVSFRVITRSEVNLHVQSFSEGSEEVGNKLGAPITSDMGGNSVFGEDVDDE